MEPRTPVPPGHGGLRPGGHPHAAGHLHPVLSARQQVLLGGDRLPTLGHRLDCQPPDDSSKRLASFTR